MASLFQTLRRSDSPLSFEEFQKYFTFNGLQYPLFSNPRQTLGEKQEEIRGDFEGIVHGAYKSNGIIFACMLARQLLFSEARFQFRRRVFGRPGELYGTSALKPLEEPEPGQTTQKLLARMIQDADLGGNWFGARRPGGKIKRLRPDWMTIVLGSMSDPDVGFGDVDAEVLGYIYKPGGPKSDNDAEVFLREEIAHFAPIPDPVAAYRGMSWLVPVIREVMADAAATTHKLRYFEQGATPSMVVSLDASIEREEFEKWVELFESKHAGVENAHKTLYLGAGSNAEVVGSDLRRIDFKAVQGAGETRISAAAGMPPVIVGLSEGLAAATYSNYGQARRRLSDGTLRPLWRDAAGAVAPLVEVPSDSELWYDDRDISFLQEDLKDEAEIEKTKAETIKTYVECGYTPESAQAAVNSGDLNRLKHSGLVSVQLQKPGSPSQGPNPQPE